MKTIILAERNKNVREFISRELLSLGYRIRGFSTIPDLLEGINISGRDDPIVLDGDFPDMDISSLVNKIRILRPTQPIIIHSLDCYENGFCVDQNLRLARKQSNLGELISALRQF